MWPMHRVSSKKKTAWAIRCMHEAQMHRHNHYITLTYDNEHLPENRSLVLDDWQLFAKRVRKRHGPFRFLHCGEYGEKELRPHLHAIMFGLDLSQSKPRGKELKRTSYVSVPLKANDKSKFPLRVHETLTDLWTNGFHTVGAVTFDSAAYVAKYTTKRMTGKKAQAAIERVDPTTGECWEVLPEYATMSRNPGLGATWFEKYCDDVYPDNFVVMKGQKMQPPAYYDELLGRRDPEMQRLMLQKRRNEVSGDAENHSPERLAVREAVAEARLTQ